MGWKNNTPGDCCCLSFEDSCPCFEGTLGGLKQSHVSGITYDEPNLFRFADINGSHDQFSVADCCVTFVEVVNINTTGQVQLCFTRADSWRVEAESPGQIFPLPPGVKAILIIRGVSLPASPFFTGFSISEAAFYKVLPDVDGFVDCSGDLSGFTFLGQDDKVILVPDPGGGSIPVAGFEDASGATVSYS